MSEELVINRTRSSAVRAATGRGWEEWLELLDAAGAKELDHKGIVALLTREYPDLSGWWCQQLTVGYEKARGKRVLGETAGGFEVGVRKTLPIDKEEAWALLVGHPERWLGEGDLTFEKGSPYEVRGGFGGGAQGEVRVVKPGERVRMTWHPQGFDRAATLQATLLPARSGTTFSLHFEKLPDAEAREAVRDHFRALLEGLLGS